MSLFEWLGEAFDPGPVGSVDFGSRGRRNRKRMGVLVCFGVSAVLLVLWAWLVLGIMRVRSTAGLSGIGLGSVIYLVIAYWVHPQPDTSNIGWLGGLFDHPFRYSDDINRTMILLVIVLWPGRFVSESLVDFVRLLAHASRSAR